MPSARAISLTVFTVPVRELCELAAKTGDLEHRFSPSPTAIDGLNG
jgi:DNA excision repair protein ERCC-2